MNPIVIFYKKIKIRLYNKKNHTHIRSLLASLNAIYGKNVRIDEGTIVASDVTIGDYSYVNSGSALQHCDVGKYCSISSNVNIGPYNHNMSGITTHPIGDTERILKRVEIGNDVLISLNAVILEGVHIGDGAIIGAGAVVTHDVGKYEVWGGVPAKFLKYRVKNESARKVLSNMNWWNTNSEDLKRLVDKYRSSLEGIESENIN